MRYDGIDELLPASDWNRWAKNEKNKKRLNAAFFPPYCACALVACVWSFAITKMHFTKQSGGANKNHPLRLHFPCAFHGNPIRWIFVIDFDPMEQQREHQLKKMCIYFNEAFGIAVDRFTIFRSHSCRRAYLPVCLCHQLIARILLWRSIWAFTILCCFFCSHSLIELALAGWFAACDECMGVYAYVAFAVTRRPEDANEKQK